MYWKPHPQAVALLTAPELYAADACLAQISSTHDDKKGVPVLRKKGGSLVYLYHLKGTPKEELKLQLEWLVMMEYGE